MKFFSTKNPSKKVSLQEAVLNSLPSDNGLYVPESLPILPKEFFDEIQKLTFLEIAFYIANHLIGNELDKNFLKNHLSKTMNFPVPLREISKNDFSLELFYGPSAAFKDFGALFMSGLMAYFNQDKQKELTILVATSGDTGAAVVNSFYNVEGIKVIVLYPSGGVSPIQEKQLTSLGKNIISLEINGHFDDCQNLVKQAFLDKELNENFNFTSANSINISRLIAQSFYYFEAYKQVPDKSKPLAFVIPSGNFGNLTAGIFALKMGLPFDYLIAGTNSNDIVPNYLKTGKYNIKKAIRTISNAMDIANPSNFARIKHYYPDRLSMKEAIQAYAFDDEQTKQAIKKGYSDYSYILDPHGAIAYLALQKLKESLGEEINGIFFETAHPAKFFEIINPILQLEIPMPQCLLKLKDQSKKSIPLTAEFSHFKKFLFSSLLR